MKRIVARIALVLTAALPAAAEEHVTVPAPLGQQNKETVVKPSGTLKDVGYGIVYQGNGAARARGTAPRGTEADVSGGVAPGGVPMPVSRAEPTGQAVVEASYLTIRGTVSAYEKGASITLVSSAGKTRALALAKNAAVYDGLKVGDAVVVRVPVEDSGACRTADRVERPKATAATAPSKFSQQVAGAVR